MTEMNHRVVQDSAFSPAKETLLVTRDVRERNIGYQDGRRPTNIVCCRAIAANTTAP